MTTLAHPTPPVSTPRHGRDVKPATFARVAASEWIKFRSVRSTVWTLVATVVLTVGISVLAAWGTTTQVPDAGATPMNGASLLSAGSQLAQLAVAVLGVLAITGEYSTGMIRSTFAAVPRRLPVLAAKALVLSVVVALVTLASMALSYVATLPYHEALDARFDLTDPETLRMIAGFPLYLAAIALFALGIGALVRHSAGAITIVIGLMLVVETVVSLVPLRLFELVSPFLPASAGSRVLLDGDTLASIDAVTEGAILSPWQGYAVLLGWVIVVVSLAALMVRRRDA